MKKFSTIKYLKETDKRAWKSAQSIVSHSFDPKIIKTAEKSSEERFQRIRSEETTIEDEEAVLLMQWRALNNLLKSLDQSHYPDLDFLSFQEL